MRIVAAAALLALAACNPAQEAKQEEEAPPAPQTALEELRAQPLEQQPVYAWQRLTQWQTANNIQPPCASVRRSEARGVVPANVDPESIYAPYVGATVFAIQCGPQLTTVRDNPAEHWLVVFVEGAAEPTVVNCAGPNNTDRCRGRVLPTVGARPAPSAP